MAACRLLPLPDRCRLGSARFSEYDDDDNAAASSGALGLTLVISDSLCAASSPLPPPRRQCFRMALRMVTAAPKPPGTRKTKDTAPMPHTVTPARTWNAARQPKASIRAVLSSAR